MVYELYLNKCSKNLRLKNTLGKNILKWPVDFPKESLLLHEFWFAGISFHLVTTSSNRVILQIYVSVRYVLQTAENVYILMNEWLLGFNIKVIAFKQMSQCLEKY